MKFSIVIPTQNRHQSLRTLIQSIGLQGLDPQEFEVLVVTNLADSYLESQDFQASFDGVNCRVMVSGKVGANRARNWGIRQAQGQYVLLLDDDCVISQSNYFHELESLHKKYPHVIAIGGTYSLSDECSSFDRAYNCVAKQWQSLDHFGDYRSSRLVGGNVCYKRDMLLESGELFDESIEFGGTEAEFHQRLNSKGFATFFIPALEVRHQTRLDYESLVKKAYAQAQGQIRYKIEGGFSEKASRTYQNKRLLLARKMAHSEEDFHETLKWMNLYDRAYNYSCENPKASRKKVYQISKHWVEDFAHGK